MEQYFEDLIKISATGKSIHEINGPTSLSKLSGLDFINAFIPEYMHCVCQDVIKMFIKQ